LKIGDGLPGSVCQRNLGHPTEEFRRLGDVEANLIDFPWTSGHVPRLNLFAKKLADAVEYLKVGRFHSATDIEDLVRTSFERCNIRGDYIRNIHVVPNLLAVPINDGLNAGQHLLGKDCKDARFSLRILPWTIDVPIP
jgi:hypothetical protein